MDNVESDFDEETLSEMSETAVKNCNETSDGSEDGSDPKNKDDELPDGINIEDAANLVQLFLSWGFEANIASKFFEHGIAHDLFLSEVQYANIEKVLVDEKEGLKLLLWQKLKGSRGQLEPVAGPSQISHEKNSKKSAGEKLSNKCDVKNVMMASETGQLFLRLIDAEIKQLNESQHKTLIKIIIDYCIKKKISMGSHDFQEVAIQICDFFPLEETQSYFIPSSVTKANPAGPLYTRYNYRLKKIRQQNLTANKSRKSKKILDTRFDDYVAQTPTRDHILAAEMLVKADKKDIVDLWPSGFTKRCSDLINLEHKTCKNILEKWPHYHWPQIGPRLINIDFDQMFPGKGNKLMEKWVKLRSLIMSSLPKNALTSEYQKKYNEFKNENQKDLVAFYALPHLVYSKHTLNNKEAPGISWSLSVPDTQRAFISSVSRNSVDQELQEYQRTRQPFGLDSQPLVLVFEDDVLNAKEYVIKFDNIRYSFTSIKTCIDIIFKLFFVFNIKYPEEAENIYMFLQTLVYEIKLKDQKVSGKVTSLVGRMKARV